MHYRAGMKLIEVVVVVLCLGIVLALLIPTIGSKGPTGRSQCSTNLKNLALAAVLYDSSRGQLPGYLNDFGTFMSTVEPSRTDLKQENLRMHRKIGSWTVSLLPWLDAQPTYEVWTEDRYAIVAFGASLKETTPEGYLAGAAPNLAIFRCPSDPTIADRAYGSNSYVCNSGMYHRGPAGEEEWTITRLYGTSVAMDLERSMAVANGAFNNQVACVDALGNPVSVGPNVSLKDFKDGLGNTILFSENLQALPWYRIGFATAPELVVNDPSQPIRYPYAARYVNGMVWHYEDPKELNGSTDVKPIHRINGTAGAKNKDALAAIEVNPINAADVARPSSAHVDGVNVGMADGRTQFIADSIDYRVYQALLTPHGKRSDVPFPDFVLIDESF